MNTDLGILTLGMNSRPVRCEPQSDSLLERLNVGVFRASLDGSLIEVNRAFLKLLGWGELLPETHLQELYLSPEVHSEHLHELMEKGAFHDYEVRLRRADGRTVPISISQILTETEDGEIFIDGLVENISERMRFEEQTRHSQKMESVGRLAAGVAHDFNNILTIIKGYTSLLADKHSESSTLTALNHVSAAADRAALLTRQLLAFSRKQALHWESLDFKEVIQNLTGLLRHLAGDKIALHLEHTANLPSIRGDYGAIEQILVNLVMNCREAMPEGGEIKIASQAVQLSAEQVRGHLHARPGWFVQMSISDSGQGMSPEILEHLFEPFFTTKDVGKGSGLGLAAVYGIVKQHKGWIDVESTLGRGTVFRIYFPAELPLVEPLRSLTSPGRCAGETVLVVEDEPELLELVSDVLATCGYQVIPATSGRKAMELWREQGDKVDLLVTDMKMPDGVGGMELAQMLTLKKPSLKVLYTSGYSPDLTEGKLSLREGENFLQKPYPPERLISTVRNCLEQSPDEEPV